MNILVTGCAGFIGSNLTLKLIEQRDNFVIGIDNFDDFYPRKIKEKNIAEFKDCKKFKLYEYDIRNIENFEYLFKHYKIDKVIHLAAKAGVRESIKNPEVFQDVNINGTKNLLEAMHKNNVSDLVFASSSSVYGNAKFEFLSENIQNLKPISPYAETKLECEKIIKEYTDKFNINAVALRFFTVYGPHQRPDLAIRKFIDKILKDEEITIFGDGYTSRDYTYIDDTVNGIIAATNLKTKYDIINVGAGNTILLKDMVLKIEKELNKKNKIKYDVMQQGDVFRTQSDIKKAERLLMWKPKVSFDEGLHRFVEFVRAEQENKDY